MEERNNRPRRIIKRKSSEENNNNQNSNDGGFGSRERFTSNSAKSDNKQERKKESGTKPDSDNRRLRKRIIKSNDDNSKQTIKKKFIIIKKSADRYVPKKRFGLKEENDEKKFEKNKSESREDSNKKRLVKKSDTGEYGRKKTEGRGGRTYDKRFDRKSDRFEEHGTERKFKKNQFEESGNDTDGKITFKSPYSKKKQLEYKLSNPDKSESIRLNKYIANAGICSRREADEYIKAGVVKINDVIITELGTKVMPGDAVKFNDSLLKSERKVYLILNKPKDYITTTDDPHAKNTVMELLEGACKERIYPVGRLDRNTTGLLLFTNDGELAKKLTHPRYGKKKIYHVFLDKNFNKPDMDKLLDGLETQEGFIQADAVSYVDEGDKKQVGVELHTGQNHAIKHLFETLGYRVEKLDRVYFAGLTKKNLPRGEWRFLTVKEVGMLRMGAYE